MEGFFIEGSVSVSDVSEVFERFFLIDKSVIPYVDWDRAEPFPRPLSPETPVAFDITRYTGDYNTSVTLYTMLRFDLIALVTFCAAKLNRNVVISDDSLNPFTWLQITPQGDVRPVRGKVDSSNDQNFSFHT